MATLHNVIVMLVLLVAGIAHAQQEGGNLQQCTASTVECSVGSDGKDPCCTGNACQPDANKVMRCVRQCTKQGEMCQPTAHEEYDECCGGSRCQFSDSSSMFACVLLPTEPPVTCKEENEGCSIGKDCCEGLECQNRRCRSPQQCTSENQECNMYDDPPCCDRMSCHGTIFTGYRNVCSTQCAGFGAYCGQNTRCCSNYCNNFIGTCQ